MRAAPSRFMRLGVAPSAAITSWVRLPCHGHEGKHEGEPEGRS